MEGKQNDMKKGLLYLGALLLLCSSLGGCKSQTQNDSADIPTTIQGFSVSDEGEKSQVESDVASSINEQEESQTDQEEESALSMDNEEKQPAAQSSQTANAEEEIEPGIFEEYEQDALAPYLKNIGEEYIGHACSLAEAKECIESFIGYWALGYDSADWWDDTCVITDTAMNGLEYRVDTLYHYSDDRADYYMMGFHYVDDEAKYIIDLMDIRPTETEEGSVSLCDVISHLVSPIPGYDPCDFGYYNKFANEEEFALAKEADENTAAYDEIMVSNYTKDEIYLRAQDDFTGQIYAQIQDPIEKLELDFSTTIQFQPVNEITYGFDEMTRKHSLVFTVTISDLNYAFFHDLNLGIGDAESFRIAMSYTESDDGGLTLDGIYQG